MRPVDRSHARQAGTGWARLELRLRGPRHRALSDPGDVPHRPDRGRCPLPGRDRSLRRPPVPLRRARRHAAQRDQRRGPDPARARPLRGHRHGGIDLGPPVWIQVGTDLAVPVEFEPGNLHGGNRKLSAVHFVPSRFRPRAARPIADSPAHWVGDHSAESARVELTAATKAQLFPDLRGSHIRAGRSSAPSSRFFR
jgi:hypothetical protein